MSESNPSPTQTQTPSPRRFRVAPPKSAGDAKADESAIASKPATKTDTIVSHSNPPPAAETPSSSSQPEGSRGIPSLFKSRGLWIAIAILAILGGISQIRLRPSVRAEAWLEPDPNARRVVHMEIPGTIRQVLVLPNQTVREGQPLALIDSESLEEDIEDTQLSLLQSHADLLRANQQVVAARARWEQAKAVESFAHLQTEKLQRDVAGLNSGNPPEHVRAYEAQLQSLQSRLDKMKTSVDRYASLAEEGIFSRERVDGLYREVDDIQALISEHRAKMETAKRQLRDTLDTRLAELNRLARAAEVAKQEYEAAKTHAVAQIPLREQLQHRLQKRQDKQKDNEVLVAPLSGTVTTQALYTLKGKTMQPGDAVLEIAQTAKLVAVIEVRQEDRDLVREGATVKFSPPEPGLPSFTTQIREIVSTLERDEQLEKSTLQVIAVIDSAGRLKPGAKVYANIESPYTISLAERLRREFLNLFKVRKYS